MLRFVDKIGALHRLRDDERGATAVLVAIVLTVLMGFVGLVMDGGMMYETRRRLQNGVDGAALAGAWELMNSEAAARAAALDYASRNGIGTGPTDTTNVSFSWKVLNVNPAITVAASRRVNFTFARVLGINDAVVGASATAIVVDVPEGDLWPWGIPLTDTVKGDFLLKDTPPPGEPGNFRAVDYPDSSGAKDYKYYILHGYQGSVPAVSEANPWTIQSEPGNIAKTADVVTELLSQPVSSLACCDTSKCAVLDIECPNVGFVPVISDESFFNAKGKSDIDVIAIRPVEITRVVGKAGQAEIYGRWLNGLVFDHSARGVAGRTLSGLIGVRLWR
ncbi:MAG: pilus assembly protein [Bacteroidetes bacterium]|nr:pilus assembly protein [Bacteroidota bacterium]MCL5026976.1 pilus assembly protein [Chloroflexota bacterium]